MNSIFLGQEFNSFESFKNSLKNHELNHKQKYTISTSRTIKSANVKYKINPELVYYEVVYGCIHRSGFKPSGKGIRNTSTLRMNCPARIKLRATQSGETLIIREINDTHIGHDLSTKVVDHLVHNRKLDQNEVKDIQKNIELGANKKQIQNMFLSEGVKKPTLKDIRNIAQKMKSNHSEMDSIVHVLENTYNCNVSVLCSEDKIFKAMYFSTPSMRNNMQAWPEFISIDGTYKLLNNGSTVFLLLVEDSDGHSEIVGICIATDEEKETISFFLNCFRNENIHVADKIKCFMGDKDLLEREVLKEIFPGIPTYLCLFHTLKTFKREITTEKMNILKKERDICLEYLQKLIYSSSSEEYDLILEQFENFAPKSVLDYFRKNWNGIKEEWTIFNMRNNFLNSTNNRLESINNKLKQVLGKNNSMMDFIRNIFVFLFSQRHERDHHAANHILKRPVSRFENDSCEKKYEMHLTRFAFQYVIKQIQLSTFVTLLLNNENSFLVKTKSNVLNVNCNKCECRYFSSMLLPCKHMFAVRKHLNLQLFEEGLCNPRWTRQYYLQHQNIAIDYTNSEENVSEAPSIYQSRKNTTLSVPQKRKKVLTITNSIANLASLSCNSIFEYRLKILKEIEIAWKQGKEVTIQPIENLSSSTEAESDQVLEITGENMDHQGNIYEDQSTSENDANEVRDEISNYDEKENFISNSDTSLNGKGLDKEEHCDSEEVSIYKDLKTIKMPVIIKKRGRPRGADLTVIGLRKKRKATPPQPFQQKNHDGKLELIFKWILLKPTDDLMLSILNGEYLLSAKDIKLDPELLNHAVLDDSLDFGILSNYIDETGYLKLIDMLAIKKHNTGVWKCTSCQNQLVTECIRCDSCLQWYHFYCVGLLTTPKTSNWFCIECYS